MPLNLKRTVAALEGRCGTDDADALLNWLIENPKGKVNLKRCDALHGAVLQVLLSARPEISSWPEVPLLRQLTASLPGGHPEPA